MKDIKCPNCGESFNIDDNKYENIVTQIKNKEFTEELNSRIKQAEQHYKKDIELLEEKANNKIEKILTEKEADILSLKAVIESHEKDKELEIINAQKSLEEKIREQEKKILELEAKNKELFNEKEAEIKKLIESSDMKIALEVNKAILDKDKELSEYKNKLELQDIQNELSKKSLQEKFDIELRQKDEAIAFYKDFKAKQSTKMLGESLEQHCEIEFNKLRMTAFPNAVFEKDNDAKTGSKGDYIYREFDKLGIEIISIMFEMKNENDQTATKKKNEHFLKELDKDRNEKKCEYAVLVSMLESDNELYNNGIVDVSYQYPKMYVVRPQFFIPIITLLRNAALNSLEYKRDAAIMREQNIDIANFEEDLEKFKLSFSRNYQLASKKFKTAIDEIDKTISHLQKTKEALLSSDNNLRIANNKAEEITIKKLVRKNPTMKEKFDNLNKSKK
ncbi:MULTISPECIES: DUF2130 domain-containing protein [unclassified Gemella]|uniref:DUF2130 domain-containing protein n=1 Tax=unclassified Gemella TaxID=2624949 RepID=UPI001C05965F|nr:MULTISPECIES: DUF2130 domain-containing protein [unclassified Gemella]MBU0278102.1 DUF2130 domain-containing protein [Gemella sp. zg-1178]QWQ38371.1 DUF2130 domain-containing protein [Gemella sp. zg-570]